MHCILRNTPACASLGHDKLLGGDVEGGGLALASPLAVRLVGQLLYRLGVDGAVRGGRVNPRRLERLVGHLECNPAQMSPPEPKCPNVTA
eukprot:1120573-Prorocentrum_minimum.AAC.2